MSAFGRLLPVTEMISSIGEGPLLGDSRHSGPDLKALLLQNANFRYWL